ncbi:hypothetical protein NP493_2445g00004 [Ridgeia piscesae]|uniref:PX domain-containing protein n=1 Tax=Ridgeia piscesae TaxID=27915 RepID=A0AAD9JGC2_RIDPI|nr:hypothetical protein NP493_2445g00004 [Ridgeia piscesae]
MVETKEGSKSETDEPGTFCPQSLMKLTVQNPVTRTTDTGRYTTYEITLETRHIAFTLVKSCVRRRYSDLVWLRSTLTHYYPDRILPDIPPKKFFSARFSEDVIETRRSGYEAFLQRLLEEGAYLSEGCLHLFLQTPLTVEEIAECTKTHSNATDIIRTVEAFSVTSPSGERSVEAFSVMSPSGERSVETFSVTSPSGERSVEHSV